MSNVGTNASDNLAELRAALGQGKLPNARELTRYDPAELDKLVAEIGEPDWSVESKAVTRQMGVSDQGKAMLLSISRRTGLSPSRALDTAIRKLYAAVQQTFIPGADEIAAALVEGRPVTAKTTGTSDTRTP